ncbi:haloacid dehalogenase superfamily, subfamily IA, variant 3 with third motif having DD or ED/haloacid dehalogenase superfamily, subfamily IA, variant 1 with third motif having Dx(3-4)D or Dx(3-4)E [Pricia antarctica]|uniref:Haloacid dehalogenase superfamily, subfamily IA, variant 3 with third motif having DD or ED/haloacid dehalogenase superfamily, subfamily IA, variant 1 with third motif having Dx(3-4)D or Dx(3-4)E n=1 Tax=Pricia antarctica TaxID=641691 RepID=A0A1G7HFX9_9FLAO|nr:HAD family phosphatase [Pricia antarctica]SDE99213.1 haloacid dehalogenase superfamily, subfamily IA, variant 3 with third motif having DD or ED/haloacid dehalogenase superfamily, subfamily IA, variant 1 with third motif having Dx(3-4)D or Dx(3-4)E [Pricia antarctica]
MITAIIFDMNGVITDDEDCHELATQKAFDQVDIAITPEIYRKYCLGRPDITAFEELMAEFQIKGKTTEDLISVKTSFYLELIKDNLKIYPGVVGLIRRLHNNYTLALTTSSTCNEVETVMTQLDIGGLFKTIVTAEDVKNGKPDPEPYLLTAEKLGVKSEDCLVIEDSENGVKSAKSAGMKCIAITNSEHPDKLQLADRIIGQYSEITQPFLQSL